MANATSTQIQELYVAYFGRAADPAGLDYWVAAGTTQAEFASHMHAQAEFQDAYGSASTENQVNQIYKNLFDREADAAGLSYWTNQINNGVLQLAEIAVDLIWAAKNNSGSADDLAALNNRSAAAVAYTAEVKASTAAMTAYQPLSTSPFSAGENFEEAKNYMLDIDGDTAHTAAGITASVDVIEANGTPAAKQSFALTDNVDNFTGGDGNDTFTGNVGQLDGDTFNGGRGSDTLSVSVNAVDDNATFTSSLIETIKIRARAATTLDFGDVTGTTGITVNRSEFGLTIENINEIDPITLDREDDDAAHTFTYAASVIGGTSDSITLNIKNSSDAGVINLDGIETINLVSTNSPTNDANELTLDEAATGTATETLNISGAGDLDLTDTDSLTITNSASGDVEIIAATLATSVTHTGTGELDVTLVVNDDTTVTAADATGALTVTASANATDLTLTGGAGDDTFEMGATLEKDDVIVGGAGTDTLEITGDSVTSVAAGDISVSGVETLEINSDCTNADDALDFDVFSNPSQISTVIVTSTLNADDVTLTDVQASTYTVRGSATGNTANQLADLAIDLKDATGTADTITINLVNRQTGTVAANQIAFVMAELDADAIEVITINATKVSSEGTAEDITVTRFGADDLESLTLTGDADLTITNALDDEAVTVNASAFTGALDLLHGTNALTYTGGTGADTIRFAADDLTTTDTITGGAGSDEVVAVLDSGTVTPTISGVEKLDLTFSGGQLNASSITDVTTIEIQASTGAGTITNLASTAATINQLGDAAVVNIGYAASAAATVTYGVTDSDAAVIANTSTTFSNVANLTINSDSGNIADVTTDLTSLAGGTALTSLTVTTGDDAGDTIDTGAITAENLTSLTTTSDAANLTLDTLVTMDDLATISHTGTGAGTHNVGAIGGTTSADALTSYVVNMSGGAVATLGAVNANDADVATFDIDLAGAYGVSSLGTFTADNITSFDIDTGADGTSFTITQFDIQETLGDVTITANEDFDITNGILVATSVGDVTIVATDSFNIADDSQFIDEATTVGNISITASGSGTGVNLGALDEATTVGNITVVANDDVEFDGADVATTIGNFNFTVAAGKTADFDDGTFGAASSTVGSITASGGGTLNLTIGAATSLGDIDLSSMTTASTTAITLNNNTTTGITATLGAGADTFIGTGGADNITTSTGADVITAGGGDDVIVMTEATGSKSVDHINMSAVAGNGNDVITGFTFGNGGDELDVELLAAGDIGAETAVAANDAQVDVAAGRVVVFADGSDGADAHAIASYTDLTDVADFIDAGIAVAAGESFGIVINDLVTDKAFVYNVTDGGDTGVESNEVTLLATITADTADAVFTIDNTVWAA